MNYQIIPVQTRAQKRAFVNFPLRLFRGNPNYVPCFYAEEMALFRKDSVYNEFSRSSFWLCYKDGKVAGRVAAIEHFSYMQKTGKKILRFSRFDFIEDFEVCRLLIETVENFAREHGYEYVHGPWGYTDMDKEGMMTAGYEWPCTYATLWNPPYYPEYVERLGYVKECEWIERRYDPRKVVLEEKLVRLAPYITERYHLTDLAATDISVRQLVKQYGKPLFDLLNICYEEAKMDGFAPFSDRFRDEVIKSVQMIFDKKFFSMLVNEKGELVGVGIAVRGMGHALNKSKGKFFPIGWIYFLQAMSRRNKELEFFIIAVHPEYQSKGVTSIIFANIMKNIQKEGIEGIETNCTLEENYPINNLFEKYEHIKHKRRKCFIKQLD